MSAASAASRAATSDSAKQRSRIGVWLSGAQRVNSYRALAEFGSGQAEELDRTAEFERIGVLVDECREGGNAGRDEHAATTVGDRHTRVITGR